MINAYQCPLQLMVAPANTQLSAGTVSTHNYLRVATSFLAMQCDGIAPPCSRCAWPWLKILDRFLFKDWWKLDSHGLDHSVWRENNHQPSGCYACCGWFSSQRSERNFWFHWCRSFASLYCTLRGPKIAGPKIATMYPKNMHVFSTQRHARFRVALKSATS